MALIAIDGIILDPQPAWDKWQSVVISRKLNNTDFVGAFMTFTMRCPALAGQDFNWHLFENRELVSLQAYAPGDIPTGVSVIYTGGVVSRKIESYTSPLDRSVVEVELVVTVNVEEGS